MRRKYFVRKVVNIDRSESTQRLYNSVYGSIDIDLVYSSAYLLGYRLLLRYVRVKHDLSRDEYEMLNYYYLALDYVTTQVFIRCFGINYSRLQKFNSVLSSLGLIEAKNKKENCQTFRITSKGREVCEDIENYWRYNIRK